MSNPFDYVTSINSTKNNMMRGSENDELAEKDYSPFVVNRNLSLFPDTLEYANMMNLNYHLDNRPQYEFLINIIRKRNRFFKGGWPKVEKDENLDAICEVYKCNRQKAVEYLKLLSKEQLFVLKKQLQKGGKL